jgi:3-deoxy-7-phosphoheptulonate synthase
MIPLPSPYELKCQLPLNPALKESIAAHRETAKRAMARKDKRIVIIAGPCSIHDPKSALDYALRLQQLQREVEESCLLVMRAYVEKPRTIAGWKGFLYDPDLDGSSDILSGLYKARKLLIELSSLGLPLATEFVDPLATPYFDDLVSWGFIGARTSASQVHRQLASQLPFPIGFKNGTEGNLLEAVQGAIASRTSHSFLALGMHGTACKTTSDGNLDSFVVLRGSRKETNYDPASVAQALHIMECEGLPSPLLIDCSHGNCQKKPLNQKDAFYSVLDQIREGNDQILGMMLESFLESGKQELAPLPSLKYGMSVTDACLDWEATETLILSAADLAYV